MFRIISAKNALMALCAFVFSASCSAQSAEAAPSFAIDKYVVEFGKAGGLPFDLRLNEMKGGVIDEHADHPQNNLVMYNAPGFRPLNIGEGEAPVFSPDGGMIAYCGFSPGAFGSQIWIMKADGSDRKKLTDLPGSPCYPAWSPDGMKIAFTTKVNELQSMFILDFKLRTINPVGVGQMPHWSPNGKQLVFLRAPKTPHALASIWIADTDGKHERLVVETNAQFPAANWSNDGQALIYTEENQSNYGVLRVSLDGKSTEKIAGEKYQELAYPSISPDGQQLFLIEWHGQVDNQAGVKELDALMVVDLKTQKARWLANAVNGDVHWVKTQAAIATK